MFPFFLWVKTKRLPRQKMSPHSLHVLQSDGLCFLHIYSRVYLSLILCYLYIQHCSVCFYYCSASVQFFPQVLQILRGCHPMSGKAPWTWAFLHTIICYLLACVQNNFFFSTTPMYSPSPLGGPDTCLRAGFTLTVKFPSSVIISRQSKPWQPFRHVLLLSCAQSLIFFFSTSP